MIGGLLTRAFRAALTEPTLRCIHCHHTEADHEADEHGPCTIHYGHMGDSSFLDFHSPTHDRCPCPGFDTRAEPC